MKKIKVTYTWQEFRSYKVTLDMEVPKESTTTDCYVLAEKESLIDLVEEQYGEAVDWEQFEYGVSEPTDPEISEIDENPGEDNEEN